MSKLTALLNLSAVPRWGTVHRYVDQRVSDHTFRVAVIFDTLCTRLGITYTAADLMAVIAHDMPECYSGDVPTPFKRIVGTAEFAAAEHICFPDHVDPVDAMTESAVYCAFKAADLIETYTWLKMWGNGAQSRRVLLILTGELQDASIDQKVLWDVVYDIEDEEGLRGGRAQASR